MKRLLLPLALLFTIPFCSSCVDDITFDVVVYCTNCTYEKFEDKAMMGKTYKIKLVPDEGYFLSVGLSTGGITVARGDIEEDITFMISSDEYDEETDILTIGGNLVSGKLTINAVAVEEEASLL